MGLISKHSCSPVITGQSLYFLANCNRAFIILIVRHCLFIGLFAVLPTSGLRRTLEEPVIAPSAAKSLCKILLPLFEQITLFIVSICQFWVLSYVFVHIFHSVLVTQQQYWLLTGWAIWQTVIDVCFLRATITALFVGEKRINSSLT
jgi:hypothetical protein